VGYAAHLAGVWDGVQHGTLDLPAGPVDGAKRLVGVHGRVDLQQQRPAHPAATNPKDLHPGQTGSKYHLLVDRRGIPLAVDLSAANTHDSLLLEAMVDAIPAVKGPRGRPGRPRRRPAKLHCDKGYDYPRCRRALRRRGITPRIARRGIEPGDKLDRHRCVVERSLAWLVGYRRLQVRYERRADILLEFFYLACALICLMSLNRPNG
jgi:transposase